MSRFTFRAQAALDLRARELQDAQRELARTQELREAARQRVDDATDRVAAAREQAAAAQRAGGDVNAMEWYRFWILRLNHERTALVAALTKREEDVTRARAACVRAQQRHDALERFRDKARAAHDETQRAAEMKLIDELATRRFAAARRA